MIKADVAVIGAGPAGAAAALYLSRAGISATLIERAHFPRFHIGESLTGECGNCLRTLGLEEEMQSAGHPIKFGVTVYGPDGKNAFWVPVKGWRPDRGLFDTSTWSVRRSKIDHMLLTGAASRGVALVEGEAIEVLRENGSVRGVRLRMDAGSVEDVSAQVLIDASGQATFLCAMGITGKKLRGNYDKQVAIFSQVAGAVRDPGPASGNSLIFYRKKHHWAWFIPLDDDVVSVGIVVPTDYYRSTNESMHEFLARELHSLNPELARRLVESKLVEEVRGLSNYSYHIREFAGDGFLCVGDSHRFIDPVFSFGVFLGMKEAEYAASAVAAYLGGARRQDANPFADYQGLCERGQDNVQELIDAFWEHPYAFGLFAHHRHADDIIHLFAGRVYDQSPSAGLRALRGINEQGRKKRAAMRA